MPPERRNRPIRRQEADAVSRALPPLGGLSRIDRIELLDDAHRVLAWKRALLTGKPIVAGIDLPVGYGPQMSIAPWPATRNGLSHAVVITGYREGRGAFRVQDSRGNAWFDSGHWWMPYEFAQSGFVYKAYALRLV